MKHKQFRVLALAAASGKVGYVFLIGGVPRHWGLSVKASKSPENAQAYAAKLITSYQPDCVVTERLTKYSRKSPNNRAVISSFVNAIDDQLHIELERLQSYGNKYDEISALARQFPQMAPWSVPKRPIWLAEHRNTIIFEALSMAVQLNEPPADLPI